MAKSKAEKQAKKTKRERALAQMRAYRNNQEQPLMSLEEAQAIINKACTKGKRTQKGGDVFKGRCTSKSMYPYKL
ncbi:hypothetical protein KW430_02740 [Vibrio fluvialis]|nr:hypothetical protein [Vibrio fluvialis]